MITQFNVIIKQLLCRLQYNETRKHTHRYGIRNESTESLKDRLYRCAEAVDEENYRANFEDSLT